MTVQVRTIEGKRRAQNGRTAFEMHTGAMMTATTANGVAGTCPRSNHWVLPTAASFGWTVEAAAANPLRYMARLIIVGFLMSGIASAFLEAKPPAVRESKDPAAEYSLFFSTANAARILRLERDFNFDGLSDIALGNSSEFGNAGGPWELWIRQPTGTYRRLKGSPIFSPEGYRLNRKERGVGVIRGCSHMSARDCTPFEIEISTKGIVTVPRERIDRKSFPECETAEFLKDHRCLWGQND